VLFEVNPYSSVRPREFESMEPAGDTIYFAGAMPVKTVEKARKVPGVIGNGRN
jgi:hypothetical protein